MSAEELHALAPASVTSPGSHTLVSGVGMGMTVTPIYVLYHPAGVEGDLLLAVNGLLTVGSDFSRVLALSDAQKDEQLAKWHRATYLVEVLERYNGTPFIDILPDRVSSAAGQYIVSAANAGSSSGGAQGAALSIVPVLASISTTQLDLLEQSYAQLVQSVYEGMLLQTRFKGYMDTIDLQIDQTGIRLDFSRMDGMLAVWRGPEKISHGGTPGNETWSIAA